METTQHTEQNKKTIRRLYAEILNTGKLEYLPEVISEEYTGVGPGKGPSGFAEAVKGLLQAFPDIQWTVEDLLAEGDKVVVRWKWTGTHTAPFQNFAASGKQVDNHAIAIYQFKHGKVIHAWIENDRLGFLQQIGVISNDLRTRISSNVQDTGQLCFVDKFFVPKEAVTAFKERTEKNMKIIRKQPGFVKEDSYERFDTQGNLSYMTVVVWQDEAAMKKAKETVQSEYRKQGFNPAEMFQRLNITLERNSYEKTGK